MSGIDTIRKPLSSQFTPFVQEHPLYKAENAGMNHNGELDMLSFSGSILQRFGKTNHLFPSKDRIKINL